MLGLRLDEPLALGPLAEALDPAGVEQLARLGLAVHEVGEAAETLALTSRGRFLGDGATALALA